MEKPSAIKDECPYKDCPCATREHQEDHDFVRAAMRVMARFDDMKWTTLKTIWLLIVVGCAGVFMLGVAAKIKGLF